MDSKSTDDLVSCLKNGGVAILPTDTVYGFSGIVDLKGKKAFKTDDRIRNIKGRSESKPLIQLISSPLDASKFTDAVIPGYILDKWPGPLTVIVPVKNDSPYADSIPTVALRCPGDSWLRSVIKDCGAPIYSTSVNRSGEPVIDEIDGIIKEFSSEVDFIVSDGDKKNALPSTLVSITDGNVKVLRQGSIVL